ncbi:MAG TPA: gamma-glutamyltransferase [Myxococcaceae bacterium]|nr:gamma-glutamyltransferase [Myxococcaceae bacterium]
MKTRALAVLLLAVVVAPARAARPYRGGVVASAYPQAAQAALEMLDRGGNAVDAAVAAAFAAGVVGPYHNGLAGGGFALLSLQGKDTLALDFREAAPAAASRDMFLRDGKPVPLLSTDGALSVAVPNAVNGYLALLQKAGSLPRSVVLAPAIRLAREGLVVTPKYHQLARPRVDCLRRDAEASRLFLRPGPDGRPDVPPLGTRIRQPELARTLERISASGAPAVRSGPIARAIVAAVRAGGGILSLEDLARIRPRWRAPLWGSYRGHRIAAFPPPSGGGFILLETLGILERARPQGFERRAPEDVHLYLEALRRAYADRARFVADPDQGDVPVARLLSPEHLAELAASIDPARATPSSTLGGAAAPGGTAAGPSEAKHTTEISVLDRSGNAVALTTTLNNGFGSCLVVPGTGLLLNDQMDDFSVRPGVPNIYGLVYGESNGVAPGRLPVSSMAPTLVFQKDRPGRVLLAVGGAGGAFIPTGVLQVLINVLDARMNLPMAVGAGRVHHQWLPDVVTINPDSLDPATRKALEAMGHTFKVTDYPLADVEAVMEDPDSGLRTGASDPRNEGAPLGQP